jgi:hypothetical protein
LITQSFFESKVHKKENVYEQQKNELWKTIEVYSISDNCNRTKGLAGVDQQKVVSFKKVSQIKLGLCLIRMNS